MGGCGAIESSRRAAGAVKDGAFTPGRPPATSYAEDPTRTCSSGGVMSFLPSDVDDAAKKSGAPAAKPDGRLCAAAEALLGWDRKDPPDESVVRFISWYFGLPQPIPRVTVTPVPSEEPKNISPMLVDPISTYAQSAAHPRYGVATQRLKKDSTKVVILMQDLAVEMDPVPTRLELNSQAPLKGQLTGKYSNPKLLISNVDGQLDRPAVPAGSKAFSATLRCGERPGRIQVEVHGEEQEVESVVANFPVMCGLAPPTSVPMPAEQTTADASRDEKKIFDAINAERSAAGLKPLTWNDAVAGVARSAAQSYAASNSIDIVGALAKADVSSPLVVQNPGRARTAEEAHARFSFSPTHRANYMLGEINSGGVGVAPGGNDPNGRPTVFLTELFIKELPPINTQEVREKLREGIARRRKDARAPAISPDPVLEEVAQKYAEALAAAKGNPPKDQLEAIIAPLRKPFRAVNIIAGAKNDPMEFAEEPGIVGTAKVYGLGVAEGAHPVIGKHAAYIAVLIGSRK